MARLPLLLSFILFAAGTVLAQNEGTQILTLLPQISDNMQQADTGLKSVAADADGGGDISAILVEVLPHINDAKVSLDGLPDNLGNALNYPEAYEIFTGAAFSVSNTSAQYLSTLTLKLNSQTFFSQASVYTLMTFADLIVTGMTAQFERKFNIWTNGLSNLALPPALNDPRKTLLLGIEKFVPTMCVVSKTSNANVKEESRELAVNAIANIRNFATTYTCKGGLSCLLNLNPIVNRIKIAVNCPSSSL